MTPDRSPESPLHATMDEEADKQSRNEDQAMNERKCKSCRWYEPGSTWPLYDNSGLCSKINSSHSNKRRARIYPISADAWLDVLCSFGCVMHEYIPEEPTASPLT